jgi:hypothetical protein
MAGRVPPELARRLPGLPTALDGEAAAASVQRLLVASETTVLSADAHSIWVRADGTCSLRYRVSVAQSSGVSAEHVVLARVHPDRASAAAYVDRQVLPLRSRADQAPGYPWRTHAAVWDDAGVGLHPFPLDPTLPTLSQAMDRARIGRLLDPSGQLPAPPVRVVRHARDGACVLGYGDDAEAGPRAYGKVYPDHTGRAVSAFLGAVSRSGLGGESGSVLLPRPLAYDAAARLLITSAVPGAPGLASVLRESAAGPHDGRSGTAVFRAHALLADCGRVLAAFHALPGSIAAVHQLSAEEDTVRAALDQVAPLWPSTAVELTRHLSRLLEDVDTAEPPVLCHGDFTPAQLLVQDGVLSGLVDFDTVCWADPALDVGRFLAHVDLAVAKATGEPGGTAGEPFANSVLRGYLDAAPGAFEGRPSPLPRIAAYRALSLARSALRACRQLKSTRAELALSVLRTADFWMRGVSP